MIALHPAWSRRSGSAAVAAFAAALLAAPALAGRGFDWPDWAALRAKYPDAAAVYLLDESASTVGYLGGEDYGQIIDTHQVIAILDPARASEWLNPDVPDYSFRQLKRLEARTWVSPDVSRKVDKQQIHEVPLFPDYVLYSDVKGRRLAFPAIARETVIELEYEHISKTIYSSDRHLFANTIPTLRSRVSVTVPTRFLANSFDQSASVRGMPPQPRIANVTLPRGEAKEFSWELRDVPAVEWEPLMPAFADVSPSVQLAPRPPELDRWSWTTTGEDYYRNLLEPQLKGGPPIRALALQLVNGIADPREKVRAIYGFVQSNIRYVAVELGIGGYQPHPAPEVMSHRYGDCKDKVTLMLSLLREAGIEGRAALLRTRSQGALDTAVINYGQFNHMIAWVPVAGRDWWLDPTAEYCAPDYLPAEDQGVPALIVSPNGAAFRETPQFPPENNTSDRRITATLDENGAMSGTLELRGTGETAMNLRGGFAVRVADEQHRLAERLLADAVPGASLGEVRVSGLDTPGKPLVVAIDFTHARAAAVADRTLVLAADFLAPPDLDDAFRKASRKYDVRFECLEFFQDRVRLRVPGGYRAELPAQAEHQSRWFTYFCTAEADSGTVEIQRRLSVETPVIPRHEFGEARKEYEKILADYAAPLRFRGP